MPWNANGVPSNRVIRSMRGSGPPASGIGKSRPLISTAHDGGEVWLTVTPLKRHAPPVSTRSVVSGGSALRSSRQRWPQPTHSRPIVRTRCRTGRSFSASSNGGQRTAHDGGEVWLTVTPLKRHAPPVSTRSVVSGGSALRSSRQRWPQPTHSRPIVRTSCRTGRSFSASSNGGQYLSLLAVSPSRWWLMSPDDPHDGHGPAMANARVSELPSDGRRIGVTRRWCSVSRRERRSRNTNNPTGSPIAAPSSASRVSTVASHCPLGSEVGVIRPLRREQAKRGAPVLPEVQHQVAVLVSPRADEASPLGHAVGVHARHPRGRLPADLLVLVQIHDAPRGFDATEYAGRVVAGDELGDRRRWAPLVVHHHIAVVVIDHAVVIGRVRVHAVRVAPTPR